MSFALLVYEQRLFNQLSQEGLADALGQPVKEIQLWEDGMEGPPIRELFKMASILNITTKTLKSYFSTLLPDGLDEENITWYWRDKKLTQEEEEKIHQIILDVLELHD